MNKQVIVDFDDFHETSGGLEELQKLKDYYPNFRVTLFTIPLKCSENFLIDIISKIDWIQLAIHGTTHENQEFGSKDYNYCNRIMNIYESGFFVRGFKAPHWAASSETMEWLKDNDFWIAIEHPYRENRKRIPKDIFYYSYMENSQLDEFGEYSRYHNHIDWGNGLLKEIDDLIGLWPKYSEFEFIDNIVKKWEGFE